MFSDQDFFKNRVTNSYDSIMKNQQSRKEFLKTIAKLGIFSSGLAISGGFNPTESKQLKKQKPDSESQTDESADDANVKLSLPTKIKSVVFVYMAGGMSHIDTLDPKKGNSIFNSISSSIGGANVTEVFQRSAKELKHLNLIRSVWSEEGAHEQANFLHHTGHRMMSGFKDLPSFGSVISYAKRKPGPYFPGHITIFNRPDMSGRSGFLGPEFSSFHISNINQPVSHTRPSHGWFTEERFSRREDYLEILNTEFSKKNQSEAVGVWEKMSKAAIEFMNSENLSAFDYQQENDSIKKLFGDSNAAKAFLLIKRLCEKEVPFIQISFGGFDNHQNLRSELTKNLRDFDPAFANFLALLRSSGLLSQTLVVLSSEFGRTSNLSHQGDGRDHLPRCWTAIVGGGDMPKGQVIGETDEKGEKILKDPIHVRDLVATVYKAAGVDHEAKLPTPSGRPFPLAPDAYPIKKLVGES